MTTIKELLIKARECRSRPEQATEAVRALLKAIKNCENCSDAYGQSEEERRSCRMAVLAEVRFLFSHAGLADSLTGIDPDEAVNDALLESGSDGKIKAPFYGDRYIHKFVDEWYADQRYAIGTYGSIVVQLPAADGTMSTSSPGWLARAVAWYLAKGLWTDLAFLTLLLLGWWLPYLGGSWGWVGFAAYPAALVVLVFVWTLLCVVQGVHVLKALVPRLAGTTILGMVWPLLAQDIWKFSFHAWVRPIWFAALMAALILASWVYLFVETQNRVGKGWASVWRATHILVRLFNFGLFVSWWSTALVTTNTPDAVKAISQPAVIQERFVVASVPVIFDTLLVPLPTALLFAAIGVLLGIYLQVLWHERPITSPL